MEFVLVALTGYAAFSQWLQYRRRTLLHRERLIAAEKGLDWPPLHDELRRERRIVGMRRHAARCHAEIAPQPTTSVARAVHI